MVTKLRCHNEKQQNSLDMLSVSFVCRIPVKRKHEILERDVEGITGFPHTRGKKLCMEPDWILNDGLGFECKISRPEKSALGVLSDKVFEDDHATYSPILQVHESIQKC